MSEIRQALNVQVTEQLVVSSLVWPVQLITLVVIGIRCYREERLRESLPLLATQLNSAIIWVFQAA